MLLYTNKFVTKVPRSEMRSPSSPEASFALHFPQPQGRLDINDFLQSLVSDGCKEKRHGLVSFCSYAHVALPEVAGGISPINRKDSKRVCGLLPPWALAAPLQKHWKSNIIYHHKVLARPRGTSLESQQLRKVETR